MKSDAQEVDFFDTLFSRCQITRKNIVDCANARYDEIINMEHIFDLKDEEDFRCCLTIPFLLDPLAAEEIITYFRDEERDRPFAKTAEPDIEKYRLLLVSAFFFNTSFFAMAWNWCALIRQELQLQMLRDQREEKPSPKFKRRFPGNVNIKIRGDRRYILQAAAGTGVMQDIGDWLVDIDDELLGRLWVNVTAGEARFLFKFETYSETPPCSLLVKCKTGDGKEYSGILLKEIERNNPENEELIIMSDIIPGFDYSDVEILELEIVEND